MTIMNLYFVLFPVMGKIAPLSCGGFRKAKATGVNLKQNKEWNPSGGASDLLDTVLATPAANLVQMQCVTLLWSTPARPRGGS